MAPSAAANTSSSPGEHGVAAAVLEDTATVAAASPPPSQTLAASISPAPVDDVLVKRAEQVDVDHLAQDLGIGKLTLLDILASLTRPTRDPREDLPPPIFRRGIMKMEDLAPGMELYGTVLNVVDFGAFVDIGLSDSGLVHISRLADRYIRDPHEVVGVGDPLKVWVLEVDKQRRRVSLTAIPPGSERPRGDRREKPQKRSSGDRPAAPPRVAQSPSAKPPESREGKRGKRPKPAKGPVVQGHKPKAPPPKPVKPITKAMAEGREPLRSFADLKQFVEIQKDKERKDEQPESS
jgi:uncharacterized protein